MKTFKACISLMLMLMMPFWLLSQTEKVDLGMIYRIKQEGNNNSKMEELAFGLTDLTGSRLTGSTGGKKANVWAKEKMEEIGFQNVRIEEAGDFSRGGWDNLKTYAAMTAPYYVNFACLPVAWTGSTNGLVRSEVILLDIRSESDLEKYRGKLNGKIILIPSASSMSHEISFEPLASRYNGSQLEEITLENPPATGGRAGQPFDIAAMIVQRQLRAKITELLKNEKASVILNNSGTYNIPRASGAMYSSGENEPVAELNIPMEAHGRIERLIRNNVKVEMEVEILNKFFPNPNLDKPEPNRENT